jgi:hypothetical protein
VEILKPEVPGFSRRFPARVAALGHWPGVQAFRPGAGTQVLSQDVKKDDETQGLFDFSVIAA